MPLVLLPVAGLVLLYALLRDDPRVNTRVHSTALLAALAACGVWWSMHSTNDVVDRAVYVKWLDLFAWADNPFEGVTVSTDPVFAGFLWLVGRLLGSTPEALFGAVATVTGVLMIAGFSRFLTPWSTLMAWLTTLCLGLYLAYTTVALRQGMAIGAMVLAVGLYVSHGTRRWGWIAVLGVLGGLTHWSAYAFTAALLAVALLRTGLRSATAVWVGCAGLFLTGTQTVVMGPLSTLVPRMTSYTDGAAYGAYGGTGNRLTFFLVSAAMVLLGWVGLKVRDDLHQRRLLVSVMAFNSVFLLLGFVAFSDRLAVYSWVLLPALVWHPLEALHARLTGYAAAWIVVVLVGYGWMATTT